MQTVTISLPASLVRETRDRAAEEGVSLSNFIRVLLAREVERRQSYSEARTRQVELMGEGLPLATDGKITWNRAELHER